ncbi:hypothetical protein GCM10010994_06850 [Chelatococcus reniformis]|uniref:DUF1178 domain-containing protein n=1 Tax=Chelatococcus reniformis TaxID=1494448 RepID=A0A916TXJ5_9HYPH|nr:hypothetical protein GCM10010994_06850 [Chelatococcus reniformis]
MCEAEHSFESWFRDSEAFSAQVEAGLVSCPACGSAKVSKSIMAPALARGNPAPEASAAQTPATGAAPVALMSDKERELRAMMRAVRHYVESHSDDVGSRFPNEARAMHAGEIEKRAIRGEAPLHEIAALIDEGIEVLPVPILPEDRN